MSEPASRRITSVDALRGVVMIIMALDHVRDFFHHGAMTQSPTNLATTTAAVFLTRWVTHICAPVFLFTAGMAAWAWRVNGARSHTALSRRLLTRGLWLVLLEVSVMRLAFDFAFARDMPVLLITLWSLGASMMLLAALVHLPTGVLATISIGVLCLHNLLDPVRATWFGSYGWVWNLFHQAGAFSLGGTVFVVGYPLLSFSAIMVAGYVFGSVFRSGEPDRRALVRRLGLGLIAAFLVLRGINIYGDPVPWRTQSTPVLTVLSFLNCTKNPPSLDFVLMTLGPALVLLAWLDGRRFTAHHPLLVFGRVPLFYFVVHFFWMHVLFIGSEVVRYGGAGFTLRPPPSMGGPAHLFPADLGYPLWVTYGVWLFVVATMYPACRWFGEVKRTSHSWWTHYV